MLSKAAGSSVLTGPTKELIAISFSILFGAERYYQRVSLAHYQLRWRLGTSQITDSLVQASDRLSELYG